MAQPQRNVSLTAPGFAGLNTQDSPLDMDISFASVANNCVIDQFGRIGSRRGFQAYTSNPEILNGNPIIAVEEFITDDAQDFVFACGNNNIYIQRRGNPDFSLLALTLPGGYTITADNWQIVSLNNKCFFVQAQHQPLVFDPAVSTTALALWAEYPAGAPGNPNAAHVAFGRLWLADFDTGKTIVYWSSLLDGEDWTGGGTGSLNTEEYWPNGPDDIVAIGAHNNFMIIYAKSNILVYQTTADVNNTISLQDTIEGIGCIARDSIDAIGEDYLFIDATGVRSLARTIQEKSVPIGDISRNVRQDFQQALRLEVDDDIKAIFHLEDSFYVCFLPNNPLTYVFDTWSPLPEGAARCTVWTGVTIRCGARLRDRTTLFGGNQGLYEYLGSSDIILDTNDGNKPVESSITMRYVSHPLDFGAPASLVFPKQVDVTLVGGLLGELNIEWAFDYSTDFNSKTKIVSASSPFFLWGDELPPGGQGAEWNDPENEPANVGVIGWWTDAGSTLERLKYNIWGHGRNLRVGFSTKTLGSPISIQEVDVQALMGRIL